MTATPDRTRSYRVAAMPGDGVGHEVLPAVQVLEHLGENAAAATLVGAIERTLDDGLKTPGLGGTAMTSDVTAVVIERMSR